MLVFFWPSTHQSQLENPFKIFRADGTSQPARFGPSERAGECAALTCWHCPWHRPRCFLFFRWAECRAGVNLLKNRGKIGKGTSQVFPPRKIWGFGFCFSLQARHRRFRGWELDWGNHPSRAELQWFLMNHGATSGYVAIHIYIYTCYKA